MTESEDEGLPDGAAEWLQRYIDEQHGYLSWLDTRVEEVGHGRVRLSVPFAEKLTNPTPSDVPPTMHGGVAATLVDTAGGLALRTRLPDPFEGGVATVNLNVNYLRRAGADLTATAEAVRAGSTIGVSTATVESEVPEGGVEPVAVGQCAYRLFRAE